MFEEAPRVPDNPPGIRWSHPSLAEHANTINISHLTFHNLQDDTLIAAKNAADGLPPEIKPNFHDGTMLPYHAVVVTKKEAAFPSEQEPEGGTGFVFLSGALGTAADRANTAVEIFGKAKEAGRPVSFSASLSSSASFDTLGKKFPRSIVDRAAQQAVFIADILQKNPCNKLYLAGHSLGGMELPYIIPLLEELIKVHRLDTRIAGLIFAAAGGQFQQGSLEAAKNIPAFLSLKLGVSELFPSPEDVFAKSQELEKAQEKEDAGLFIRVGRELEEMNEKRGNPPYLSEEQKHDLTEIDTAIKKVMEMSNPEEKERQLRQLRKRRYKFLHPVILNLNSADDRNFSGKAQKEKAERAQLLNFGLAVVEPIFPVPKINILRPPPRKIGTRIRGVPVAFIWGGKDVFFSPQKAGAAMTLSQIYPYVSAVYHARIAGWPHEAIATNAPKFAEIFMDIVGRMGKTQETGEKPQQRIDLFY